MSLRVGIVGTGSMGLTHLEAWRGAGIPVTAYLSRNPANAPAAFINADLHGTDDVQSFFDRIDIVDVCTPTHLHASFAVKAAREGKDVICEKPLARTLAEARKIIQVCEQENVRLMPAHVLRFFPEYKAARDQVASGALGKPAVLRFSRESCAPRKTGDNWFLDDERSGGVILDLMFHDFDYALWVAGPVTRVYAKAFKDRSVCRHALVVLQHANGAISHLQGSWLLPEPEFRTRFEIACTHRLIVCDSTAVQPLNVHWRTDEGAGRIDAHGVMIPGGEGGHSPYREQLECLYRAASEHTSSPVTAAESLEALVLALSALESAQSGRPVDPRRFAEENP